MYGKIIVLLTLIGLVPAALAFDFDPRACFQQAQMHGRDRVVLAEDCPHVYQGLQRSGLARTLEQAIPGQLTQAQLEFLQASTHDPENVWGLDENGLDELLASILADPGIDQESSWWKQFLDWLNSFKPDKYEAEYDWLVNFLEAITPSERFASIILFAVIGLTILSAAGLVLCELYVAGVFSRRTGIKSNASQQQVRSDIQAQQVRSLSEIQQLEPDLQVVALFNKVIRHLIEKKLLPGNSALTNIELKQHLNKHRSYADSAFTSLVENIEPVLYGHSIPSEQVLEDCWQNAQKVLAQ